jgi:hypothetical protein
MAVLFITTSKSPDRNDRTVKLSSDNTLSVTWLTRNQRHRFNSWTSTTFSLWVPLVLGAIDYGKVSLYD